MKQIILGGLYPIVGCLLGRLCALYLGMFDESGVFLLFLGGIGLTIVALIPSYIAIMVLLFRFKSPIDRFKFLKETFIYCVIWGVVLLMIVAASNHPRTLSVIAGGSDALHIAGAASSIIGSLVSIVMLYIAEMETASA